ncbi:MAG TPA: hypothetical protein VFQ45_11325 [Longimicrobium sp.]|nr:hypothetical protein [Longimicrobium sp.]
MRLRSLPALLALTVLAACGGGGAEEKDETTAEPFDTTAPAPAAPEAGRAGAIDRVNQRLDQAERDAAAREADAAEQLRQAGGAGADSL